MSLLKGVPVGLLGTGIALPEKVLTNQDLEKMVETSDQWIVERTGIRTRHVAAEGTVTTDLAEEASRKALAAAGVAPEDLDLILVESGGDNLTATFSSGLVDAQIFVVDVAGGDKVPRKGGPGVTFSDLLVINKTDLAPMVGADLDVMRRDAGAVRGPRPFVLISLTTDPTAAAVLDWVREQLRVAQEV